MVKKLTDKRQIRLFTALCCVVYFTSYLTRLNYAAAITAIIADLGMTKALASLAVTGSFFTYGLGQLVSGLMGDLVRPHKMIFAGLFGTALCNIAMPLLPAAGSMTVIWCINGFFQAMLWPPLVRIMAEFLNTEDFQNAASAVSVAACVGTVVVYCMVPLCLLFSGWRMAFYLSAACCIVACVVWLRGARRFGLAALIGRVAHPSPQQGQASLREISKASGLGVLAVAIILVGVLRDGVNTWMPTNLTETYNLPPAGAIAITAVVSLFNIAAIAFSFRLQKRLKNEVKTSFVLFAIGLVGAALLVPFVSSGVLVSSLLMSVIIAAMYGVNHMLIGRVPAHFARYNRVSTISGLLNFFIYVGSALSTYGIALLSENFGWSATVTVWALLALAGTVCCLLRIGTWARFTGAKE